jgi:hypothetical protein
MRRSRSPANMGAGADEGGSTVKWPKVKTLNHQIDVIEANSTATEARLAKIEELLARIAEELEKKPV